MRSPCWKWCLCLAVVCATPVVLVVVLVDRGAATVALFAPRGWNAVAAVAASAIGAWEERHGAGARVTLKGLVSWAACRDLGVQQCGAAGGDWGGRRWRHSRICTASP